MHSLKTDVKNLDARTKKQLGVDENLNFENLDDIEKIKLDQPSFFSVPLSPAQHALQLTIGENINLSAGAGISSHLKVAYTPPKELTGGTKVEYSEYAVTKNGVKTNYTKLEFLQKINSGVFDADGVTVTANVQDPRVQTAMREYNVRNKERFEVEIDGKPKESGKFGERSLDDGVNTAGSVFKVGDNIAGFFVNRIKNGTNGKIAVVGRKMAPVETVGNSLVIEGKQIELFNFEYQKSKKFNLDGVEYNWSAIDDEFNLLKNQYGTIPNNILENSLMFKANKAWAEKVKTQGYTIIDLGNPTNESTQSIFYNIEITTIF